MKCPVCSDVNLVMSERQGIEIDYCPDCRGVWLDRGELDKIIERAAPSDDRPQRQDDRSRQPEYASGHHDHHRKKKRSSLLGDLFDF